MKSKFFIFVIIIIIIVGIYFVAKKPSVQAPTTQEQAQTQSQSANSENSSASSQEVIDSAQSSSAEKISKAVINYTDKGFSPSPLQIKVGQTVQFVNKSASGMWVASGQHPTHTDYPGFDAKKAAPNGGIYEFTFTKVGAWKYHNHLNPTKSGLIIVK